VDAVSFFIRSGVATINLGAGNLPAVGYNGPNNAIQGNWPSPNGQQVTLWGFTTAAAYFNGKNVTVIYNDPTAGSFSFYINHADVGSLGTPTADAGKTAPIPVQRYRAVRIECGQALSTDLVYVGDGSVSSSRYVACLSLAGQLSIEVAGENIPPERVFIKSSGATDVVQVSLIY